MNVLRKVTALILMLATLFLVACGPKDPPDVCEGEHIDADGNLVCDACGETIGADPENPEEPEAYPDSFLPVLRFAITSDVHVRSTANDYDSKERLAQFISSAYEYADGYTPYTALDGVFVVGDLTQDGKEAEYEISVGTFNELIREETTLRVTMGNHEMHAYGSGDGRFTADNIAKSTARFISKLGYESENWHAVINGYHFISIANDTYKTRDFFDEETIAWLKGEIEAAMADDPTDTKPIFVMNHQPPKSDVRGFTGGDILLGELLVDYPRVVDFSGHTHRSIIDPQSIWQDGFTAIGTGGLAYLGYNMAGHPALDNSAVVAIDDEGDYIGGGSIGTRSGAMYYIVEIDKDNNIRLRIYDLLTDSFYGDPIIFKVGANEPEVFTADRADASVAPIFPEGAVIEVVSPDFNLPKIKFPTPTGGDLTQYYKIELTADGATKPELTFYRLGVMHKAADPEAYATTPIRWVSVPGTYSIKVYAVNCWGKVSEPLSGSITVGESSLTPDILNTVFNEDGTATNGDTTLKKQGTSSVTVSYNEELGKTVATFDGKTGYKFEGIKDYYKGIVHSISIEACFRAGETEPNTSIGANNDSAGFGLHRLKNGAVRFSIRFNNGGGSNYLQVTTAPGTAEAGEWVHVVVVYNGSTVKIYVNGEAAMLYDEDGVEVGTSISCSGRLFQAPNGMLNQALIVGGDISNIGTLETGFIGDIAAYNLFSRPLTSDEAARLAAEYRR